MSEEVQEIEYDPATDPSDEQFEVVANALIEQKEAEVAAQVPAAEETGDAEAKGERRAKPEEMFPPGANRSLLADISKAKSRKAQAEEQAEELRQQLEDHQKEAAQVRQQLAEMQRWREEQEIEAANADLVDEAILADMLDQENAPPLENTEEYIAWKIRQQTAPVEAQLTAIEAERAGELAAREAQETIQELHHRLGSDVDAFTAEHDDYQSALEHLQASRLEDWREARPDLTTAQLQAVVSEESLRWAVEAIDNGWNAAEYVYQKAQEAGWGDEPAPAPAPAQAPREVEEYPDMSGPSVASPGGRVTGDDFAALSLEERRAMVQRHGEDALLALPK